MNAIHRQPHLSSSDLPTSLFLRSCFVVGLKDYPQYMKSKTFTMISDLQVPILRSKTKSRPPTLAEEKPQ